MSPLNEALKRGMPQIKGKVEKSNSGNARKYKEEFGLSIAEGLFWRMLSRA